MNTILSIVRILIHFKVQEYDYCQNWYIPSKQGEYKLYMKGGEV